MSKKGKRDERLTRGDEFLEARGVDLEAEDDLLLPSLVAQIGVNSDADLSIVDLMGSIPLEASALHLLEWEKRNPEDKDLKREIRRSLFRLQQRGVTAAAREAEPSEPRRIIDPIEPSGYLSPLDGAGNRLAWLTRPRPEGGLWVMSSVINDTTGMRQIYSHPASRAQLKEMFSDAARHMAPVAPAPARYVDWLISEAYRKGAPRDEQGGGYPLQRAEFYLAPAAEVPSPLGSMLAAASEEETTQLLAESARLFGEKEFVSWFLPDEQMKEHQARFVNAQESTLTITKEQLTDRLRAIIEQAFDEVLAGPNRSLYAQRLGEMALWYMLASREPEAKTCDALHRALSDPARPLAGASFLQVLVHRSFLHLLPQKETAGEGDADRAAVSSDDLTPQEAPGLIVRPK